MRMLTEYDEDKVRALWEDYGEEKGIGIGEVKGEKKRDQEILALIEQGLSLDEIKNTLQTRLAGQT